ncbi:MAG: PhzF family phenazine biosynthesis protein [Mariprofundales bacterium]|nr:PhzF family phenazine biosynthesis protein [Mariprofundales bacterium]
MKIQLYYVDAFADRLFAGNPAAVCPVDHWLPDAVMQSIAAEINLSETAFFTAVAGGMQIRWFTPACEVQLCGHATLAAAHVLFNHLDYRASQISFQSVSGRLPVVRDGDRLTMDFPAQCPSACPLPTAISVAFSSAPVACLRADDYMVVCADQVDVLSAQPDISLLQQLDLRGVIITAPSCEHDFVSRFFAPKLGIDEDPVTGSAHAQLAPYWAERLGRSTLRAKQLSARGGVVDCEVVGSRVLISGGAVTFMQGEITI